MTLHLIKLCVGVDTIADLARWQTRRIAERRKSRTRPYLFHATRMVPKRQAELLDGGSLYWIVKGLLQVRQRISGFSDGIKPDGTPCCLIHLDRKLVAVRPVLKRAFQGWRYLPASEAPPDLANTSTGAIDALPPKMRKELAELGLI
ncbi:MAG: DUF1489 family protein [Hyphomicrobiaceae bacterium]